MAEVEVGTFVGAVDTLRKGSHHRDLVLVGTHRDSNFEQDYTLRYTLELRVVNSLMK